MLIEIHCFVIGHIDYVERMRPNLTRFEKTLPQAPLEALWLNAPARGGLLQVDVCPPEVALVTESQLYESFLSVASPNGTLFLAPHVDPVNGAVDPSVPLLRSQLHSVVDKILRVERVWIGTCMECEVPYKQPKVKSLKYCLIAPCVPGITEPSRRCAG